MPKKKAGVSTVTKELFIAEEKVLFEFLNYEIKKRHFFSVASILVSLSLGLFVIRNLAKQGTELFWPYAGLAFTLSLIFVSVIVRFRVKRHKKTVETMDILKRVIPLYTIALGFALVYVMLNFLISNSLLGIKDVVFMTSITTIFETITFHVH